MLRLQMIAIQVCMSFLVMGDDIGKGKPSPVADALDWYSVWWGSGSTTTSLQTCSGEFRSNIYSFRCDPLSVVVEVVKSEMGSFSIVAMRPAVSGEDGLRVHTLAHLFPPRPINTNHPQRFGELPGKEGVFEITIMPRSRPVNSALTRSARLVALQLKSGIGDSSCGLRIPLVKLGDPFFHVYEECKEIIRSVWEFNVSDGQIERIPHWSYTEKRGGVPSGSELRRFQTDLWLGLESPSEQERKSK